MTVTFISTEAIKPVASVSAPRHVNEALLSLFSIHTDSEGPSSVLWKSLK